MPEDGSGNPVACFAQGVCAGTSVVWEPYAPTGECSLKSDEDSCEDLEIFSENYYSNYIDSNYCKWIVPSDEELKCEEPEDLSLIHI